MLNLAVEESMFVEDIYASSQAIVRADNGRRINQLRSLIGMLQDRIKAPEWLCSVILCKKHLPGLTKKRITQEIGEPFLWTDSRVELVKLL